jgi:capsular polysaccharide biosynthesis protein
MSLTEFAAVVLRRWYVAVPGLLLSCALAVGVFSVVPPKYESKVQLLLVPPNIPNSPGAGLSNPYLNFGPGLLTTADILSVSETSQDAAQRVASAGGRSLYTVARDTNTSGPVIDVSATDKDSGAAARTVDVVVKQLTSDLNAAQQKAGAPESTWIKAQVLTRSPAPKKLLKSAIQASLAVGLGGFFSTVLVAVLLERREHRRRRREVRREASAAATRRSDEPASDARASRSGAGVATAEGSVAPVGSRSRIDGFEPDAPVELESAAVEQPHP